MRFQALLAMPLRRFDVVTLFLRSKNQLANVL